MSRSIDRPFRRLPAKAAVALLAVIALMAMAIGAGQAHATMPSASKKPTIVLVHGAWANSASWDGVIGRLQSEGYSVDAPPNPLRSLKGDAATIADFIKTIKGPVVLVGHSYGGAVITNAARGLKNVKALVYVDAFAPEQGESAFELTAKFPGSALTAAPPSKVFDAVPFPEGSKSDPLLYVRPSVFVKAFANDLSAKQGSIAAANQAPAAMGAVTDPSGPPAWKTISSWYVVGTVDRVIPPVTQMFMAERAHAQITKVHGGHLSMVSHPDAVAKVIAEAAHAAG